MPETGAAFSDLLTELYARGYDHLSQDAAGVARASRWINQAYLRVTLEELWPFRLTTSTGAAPLEITDLDQVLSVIDTGNDNTELQEMTEAEMASWDLTDTGTPAYFYRDSLYVRTFPIGGTLSVRYYKVPTELSAGSDTTIVPKRYLDVIIDDAVRRAAKDRDNERAVALAKQEYDEGLSLMRRQLNVFPKHMAIMGESVDW